MTSTRLFWLRPPADSQSREVDPIGMSSLHEAAANVLLPNISGRTREASDYLWTLIGLREGGEDGSSRGRTDAEIWQSFACFEKALKMYWYESRCQPRFDGIKAVRWQDDHGREDLDFQLLSNQRSQGLLGAYVRSLREAGLVESRSLRLSAPGKTLVSSVNLRWGGKLTRQWRGKFEWATHELTSPAGREMKAALGQKLFCPQEMCGAAHAIRVLGAAPKWPAAACHLRDPAKQALAKVGTNLLKLLKASTRSFWAMLQTPDAKVLPLPTAPLRQTDWLRAIYDSPATVDHWREFLATAGRSPAAARDALVALHDRTWQDRGHDGQPWISFRNGRLWVRPDIRFKSPSPVAGWDLRWSVCDRLIRQTHWRPS